MIRTSFRCRMLFFLLIFSFISTGCATMRNYSFDTDPLAKMADEKFGVATTPESRLVRAYAIVAAMAAYGARTISENDEQYDHSRAIEDAVVLKSLLGHAEQKLDKLNEIVDGAASDDGATEAWSLLLKELPDYTKAYGVYTVRKEILAVAKAALGPYVRETSSMITRIIAGGTGGLLTNSKSIVNLLRKVAEDTAFRNALLDDIRNKIEIVETAFKSNEPNKKSIKDNAIEIMKSLISIHKQTLTKISG